MLILQRKVGQSLLIGDNITISITEINSDKVKISISAPQEIPIMRTELLEAADTNREAVATDQTLSILKNLFPNKKY